MKNENDTKTIVVIGGTGLIGSKLVSRLQQHGFNAVPAAPSTGVNTLTGEGLADALQGASVVVDVTNSPSFEAGAVMNFFTTSTANLLKYGSAAGIQHHVLLSVVGADRLAEAGSPYMRAKIAQEELVKGSPISYSIVRATQFFEFITGIADAATDAEIVRLPRVRFRPIAADDVITVLSEIVEGVPVLGTVDTAGPEEFYFDDLVRRVLTARQDSRSVVADSNARYFGAELQEMSLVPVGEARIAESNIDSWLNASANKAATGGKAS